MNRLFSALALAGLASTAAAASKDRVLPPVHAETLGAAGTRAIVPAELDLGPVETAAPAQDSAFNPLDFTEVHEAQSLISLGNAEIGSTVRVHDAVREAAFRIAGLRTTSLPHEASDVNFDGSAPRQEAPGFYDVLGAVRRDGIREELQGGKGVKALQFSFDREGHRLVLQDIEGRWPSEFYMTRVFFFREIPGGRPVQVKTDGEGNVTAGQAADFLEELRWWRERLLGKKKPA